MCGIFKWLLPGWMEVDPKDTSDNIKKWLKRRCGRRLFMKAGGGTYGVYVPEPYNGTVSYRLKELPIVSQHPDWDNVQIDWFIGMLLDKAKKLDDTIMATIGKAWLRGEKGKQGKH